VQSVLKELLGGKLKGGHRPQLWPGVITTSIETWVGGGGGRRK